MTRFRCFRCVKVAFHLTLSEILYFIHCIKDNVAITYRDLNIPADSILVIIKKLN